APGARSEGGAGGRRARAGRPRRRRGGGDVRGGGRAGRRGPGGAGDARRRRGQRDGRAAGRRRGGVAAPPGPAGAAGRGGRAHRGQRVRQLLQGDRGQPGAAPDRRGGAALTVSPLRLGAGVAGAAALIAAVTGLARIAGFGRTVVFSQTVGDTCVGTAYVTANQLPTVLFEIVIGGALAGTVVPLLASAAARGDTERVRQTASALVTWVVLLAVPLSLLLAAASWPVMALMLGGAAGCDRAAVLELAVRFLVVFAPQIVFYGLAAVLYGILQAHRRFLAPALAPLVSSRLVAAADVASVPLGGARRGDPAALGAAAELTLSAGTTVGVAALFGTALVPALRLRLRLRPRLSFPPGEGRRARSLAAA